MRVFWNYFETQLKRVCRAFPFVIGMTLLLMTGVMLLLSALQEGQEEKQKKVEIAVTGDTDSSYLGIGLTTLQHLDVGRYSMELLKMPREEAERKMQTGEISAYVVIPQNLVECLNRGERVEFLYASSHDAEALAAVLLDEIVGKIEEMCVDSQKGINGVWTLMLKYSDEKDPNQMTDRLFIKLMDVILNRTMFYEISECGWGEELSMTSYMVVGITIIFLLFWGIIGSHLLVKNNTALPRLMKARGYGCLQQVLAEYLAYFVLMFVSLLLLFAQFGKVLELAQFEVEQWQKAPLTGPVCLLLQLVPVMLMLAAMQFMLYELVSDMISAILLQFLTGLCMGFLSGCFYPLAYLPESIQKLSLFLPVGAAMRYGTGCMQGILRWSELGVIGGFLLLFLLASAWLRKRRIME